MLFEKHLHIISLNVPWPPNYGGIIDIYHQIRHFHKAGIKIILHCFEYERPPAPELERYCIKVYYYKRQTGLISNISLVPYNVYSRKHPELIKNLLKDDHPILFEGLHSCYYINDPRLKTRQKIYRACNIEHDYYLYLARSCNERIKKLFFHIESYKFKRYEKVLRNADLMLAVSITDQTYLQNTFPDKKVEFFPTCHSNDEISIHAGHSDFILYHAKLSVFENEYAALYLIENVFSQLEYTCIIAGMDPSATLYKASEKYPNIHIEANPDEERMNFLIREAQIHMLITFQDTGLKLKLLNSLFRGRHVVVNQMMLAGSGLNALCHIADHPKEMIEKCRELMKIEVNDTEIEQRKEILYPTFFNSYQIQKICKILFDDER